MLSVSFFTACKNYTNGAKIDFSLKIQGFSKESDNVWSMSLNTNIFKIDLKEEKIRYPKLIKIGRNTITNFEAEENFVVLNATINLVRQGYASENIEIEKGYRLGLNTKSGNAEITVTDLSLIHI